MIARSFCLAQTFLIKKREQINLALWTQIFLLSEMISKIQNFTKFTLITLEKLSEILDKLSVLSQNNSFNV